ncbi:ribonuclease H-like protein [Artomyces pyxidatus]|uniref:Ribonuclease H-like protein n=1 Tax=Artomyces pyxidatus TaxID=48021 RepID=A0ACB8T4X1_9AGAM|nr:ribonuclease H-like protein [Artomyces pyxidatus]
MQDFPAKLREFLESPRSIKVGVGIQSDCRKLYKDYNVSIRNCVELALMARSVDSRWKGKYENPIGLARLTETYLDRTLVKGKISISNWENELTKRQQDCEPVSWSCGTGPTPS